MLAMLMKSKRVRSPEWRRDIINTILDALYG